MNFSAVEHISDSKYCFAINESEMKVRLKVDKNDHFQKIECLYNNSQFFYKTQKSLVMNREFEDDYFAYYSVIFKCDKNDPRSSYVFLLTDEDGQKYFFSEDGLTKDYDFSFSFYNRFGIPYINKIDIKGNKKFEGSLVYQIFPERFNCSDFSKKYINQDWYSLSLKGDNNNRIQNVFLGGDFNGITSKIDYIADLGFDTIYLTPICQSPSNHKYDVIDYFKVDEMFGTTEDFKNLVGRAHQKGIKIILDLVFNHSSNYNEMFLDALKNGKASKYFNYYCIHDEVFKDSQVNYETFGFTDQMPKLNSNNFDEHDYFVEVGKYFIKEYNIDGYRLDVADEVSHTFWRYFKHEMKRVKEDILLIGEHWTDSTSYLSASELDSVMNYPFFVASKYFYIEHKFNAQEYAQKLNSLLLRYDDNTNKVLLNLLDSHDTVRFYNFVKNDKNLYLIAFLTLIVYPGMSMIYYGDEIFMEGGFDPDNRRGMLWNSKEFDSKEHQTFKDILKLKQIEVIRHGDVKIYAKDDLLIIDRFDNQYRVRTIINNSGKDKNIDLNNIILMNNYQNKVLKDKGFVVIKEDI